MELLKPGFTREDLLRISEDKLPVLAKEVRAVIIDTVRKNGGHFSLTPSTTE